MVQVEPIKAFSDNYIWAIHHGQQTWVVDPGDAEPVLRYLSQHNKQLAGILVTHHHWDHTNGIEQLTKTFEHIPVFGPKNSPCELITQPLSEGDTVQVGDIQFAIIETPGHTLDHICYTHEALCFTGDTLFSAGCGRLFEGDAQMMWQSLEKFKRFNDDTLIYCTHEYTLANLAFARAVEPTNAALIKYSEKAEQLRAANAPTLPSNFATERAINPFLRSQIANITSQLPEHVEALGHEPWQNFAAIRAWKDEF